MKIRNILSSNGFSVVEITVGLFISSILLTTAYKANQYFTKSTMHETVKSSFQKDIITVSDFLTKDIRMSGLNLPGNGIRVTLNNNANDQLEMYTNDSGHETSLAVIPGYCDSKIRVLDGAGMVGNQWICLNIPSDTVYRQIMRVGMNINGADTIYLYQNLDLNLSASTRIYPAKRVRYSVTAPRGLERSMNGVSVSLGKSVEILEIIPKSLTGNVLGNMGKQAAVLHVYIGSRLKSGNGHTIISDSVEVNLRNRG